MRFITITTVLFLFGCAQDSHTQFSAASFRQAEKTVYDDKEVWFYLQSDRLASKDMERAAVFYFTPEAEKLLSSKVIPTVVSCRNDEMITKCNVWFRKIAS